MKPPRFWSAPDHPAGALLSPLGAAYGVVVRRRLARAAPWRAPVPVICAGNVTMGGVGKTPWTILLARMLTERGRVPHVLTRGYGGTARGPLRVAGQPASEVGDEALLLARAAPAWVGADRAASAAAACEAGADTLLMDDGFQNPSLAKNLSFLLLAADAPLGNGRVFPAGPLRERPGDAARRADVIVSVGTEGAPVPDEAQRLADGKPVLRAWLTLDTSHLGPRPVHAVAGIGRPKRFFDALAAAGHRPARTQAYPDHHPFTEAEIERVLAAAGGAQVVTTEKDHVRLPPRLASRVVAVPAVMRTDEAALDAILDGALAR